MTTHQTPGLICASLNGRDRTRAVLINKLLLSCSFGYVAECICWGRLPETWSVGLLKKRVQASLLSIGVGAVCVPPPISPSLPRSLPYLYSRGCVSVCLRLGVCVPTRMCVWAQACRAPPPVYSGTDGRGMHHPFRSRVLARRPPTADGVNHRPFWAWHSIGRVGTWEIKSSREPTHGAAPKKRRFHVTQPKERLVLPQAPCRRCHFVSRASGRLGSGIGWECLHNWPESQESFLVGRFSKRWWAPYLQATHWLPEKP